MKNEKKEQKFLIYLWILKAKSFGKFFTIRFTNVLLHLKSLFQPFSLRI